MIELNQNNTLQAVLLQETNPCWGDVMRPNAKPHPEVDYFSPTAQPAVFYSSYTTAIRQTLQLSRLCRWVLKNIYLNKARTVNPIYCTPSFTPSLYFTLNVMFSVTLKRMKPAELKPILISPVCRNKKQLQSAFLLKVSSWVIWKVNGFLLQIHKKVFI